MIKLTRHQLLFGSLALALLIMLVLIAVMLSRQTAEHESEDGFQSIRYQWITPDRLLPPDDYSTVPELEWVPHRPRKDRWAAEDVEEHWFDPSEIGIDVLMKRIEADVDSLLKEVP